MAQLKKIRKVQRAKLQGDFLHMKSQNWLLQYDIAARGLSMAGLEQKLAVFLPQPTKIVDTTVTVKKAGNFRRQLGISKPCLAQPDWLNFKKYVWKIKKGKKLDHFIIAIWTLDTKIYHD